VLLVRTCLGEPHVAQRADQHMRLPPERPDGRGPLSSTVALTRDKGGVVDHPEYIVYEETQTLPQYAVWYHHSGSCKCTHCDPT
jgi:hypothetical protein